MSDQHGILALDLGTSCVKAALFYQDGSIAWISQSVPYPTVQKGNQVEQDANDWWSAASTCIRECTQHNLPPKAIALTGQMQCVLPISADGVPLRHAILHNDTRASAQAKAMEDMYPGGVSQLHKDVIWTGGGAVVPKILWLMEHEEHVVGNAWKVLVGAHSFVCMKLCGAPCSDYTTASTTGLLHMQTATWSQALLSCSNLQPDLFPALQKGTQRSGVLTRAAALALSLPEGLPVYHGCGDLGATSFGAGCTHANAPPYVYIGTSGWVAAARASHEVCAAEGVFTLMHPEDPLSTTLTAAACSTAGGNVESCLLRFFHEGKDTRTALREVDELASASPAGSHGVVYLPYISGERSPFYDINARACFVGVSLHTSRHDMHRAVLEGVAMSMRSLLEALEHVSCQSKSSSSLGAGADWQTGGGVGEEEQRGQRRMQVEDDVLGGGLLIVGGGAASDVWMQILADVMNRKICAVSKEQTHLATLRGAYLLAAVGEGWWNAKDFARLHTRWFPKDRVFSPCASAASVYNRLYPCFRKLYVDLRDSFAALAALDQHTASSDSAQLPRP